MAQYKIGHWTKSTLDTLEFVEKKELEGIFPRAKDFSNRTMINWIYILKDGGYVNNGNGFHLSDSGKELLKELRENKGTLDRRGRKSKKKRERRHEIIQTPSKNNNFNTQRTIEILQQLKDLKNEVGGKEKLINLIKFIE